MKDKETIVKEFQTIPGVSERVACELYDLGYISVEDLKDREPHMMYERLCMRMGQHVDRSTLYIFRCAVYYASHTEHDPEKLKWQNWKDEDE